MPGRNSSSSDGAVLIVSGVAGGGMGGAPDVDHRLVARSTRGVFSIVLASPTGSTPTILTVVVAVDNLRVMLTSSFTPLTHRHE